MYEVQPFDAEKRNNDVDEYRTPLGLIVAAVVQAYDKFHPDYPLRVLDAGANTGNFGKVVRALFPNAIITGWELMDMPCPSEYNNWIIGDFLSPKIDMEFDYLGWNPPYSLRLKEKEVDGEIKKITESVAEKFILRMLTSAAEVYLIHAMLRSGFTHSKERLNGVHLIQHYKRVAALTPRPNFPHPGEDWDNKTNPHEYSLFTWENGWNKPWGIATEMTWVRNITEDDLETVSKILRSLARNHATSIS
jgi:hypothetical protein